MNLVPLNFPYHLIDSGLLIIVLVCVNLTSGAASQIVGFAIVLLRLILTVYIPFYNEYNQRFYKLIAISSAIASLGLLISYYNINRNYNLFIILVLVIYLIYVHASKEEVPAWQEVTV